MANRQAIVHPFPSTTYRWILTKMPSRPTRQGTASSQTSPHPPLRNRDRRERMVVSVQWHGGPDASWVIHYRGTHWRFCGHDSLHDVLASLYMSHGEFRAAQKA